MYCLQVSLFEPATRLVPEECLPLPDHRKHVQAVEYKGKVYIGSGYARNDELAHKIHCYNFEDNEWAQENTTESLTRYFAMTTFCDTVLLVGGIERESGDYSKGIQYLSPDGKTWILHKSEDMPEMHHARAGAAASSLTFNVIVAGGYDKSRLRMSKVEVYDRRNKMWYDACDLPQPCADMKSAVHSCQWYLLGGANQYNQVFTTSLQDLVMKSVKPLMADARGSGTENGHNGELWTSLSKVEYNFSSVAVFGRSLVAIGGEKDGFFKDSYSSSIFVYNNSKDVWMHVADLPFGISKSNALALSTGELLVIGGRSKDERELNLMHKYKLACTKSCVEQNESPVPV